MDNFLQSDKDFQDISPQAAVLFIDIEDSVAMAANMKDKEYDTALTEFTNAVDKSCDLLKEKFGKEADSAIWQKLTIQVPEYHGDECMIVVSIADISNDAECFNAKGLASLFCLSLAIMAQKRWFISLFSQERMSQGKWLPRLACGIHIGPIIERQINGKPDFQGYSISLAKRIETASRNGINSHIALSGSAHSVLINTIIGKNNSAKQHLFFQKLTPNREVFKGVGSGECLFELIFYTRLDYLISKQNKETIDNDSESFMVDSYDLTAITDRIDRYVANLPFPLWYNWVTENIITDKDKRRNKGVAAKMVEFAGRVLPLYPGYAKIHFDMAYFNWVLEKYDLAIQHGLRALEIEPELDLAYQILRSCERKKYIGYSRKIKLEGCVEVAKRRVIFAARAAAITPSAGNRKTLEDAEAELKNALNIAIKDPYGKPF